jgi:hypothetical protein
MRLPRSAAGAYRAVEPSVPSEHDAVHFEKDASVPCYGSHFSLSGLDPNRFSEKGFHHVSGAKQHSSDHLHCPKMSCARGNAYSVHQVWGMNDALCTKSSFHEQVKLLTLLFLINIHLSFTFILEKTAEIFFLSGSTAGIRANEQPGGPFAGLSGPHSASPRSSFSKRFGLS